MDLKQLEVFHCVYEQRSFSRAAQRLGLTQPTISGHIKSLEEYFGTSLLDRLGRETLPTRAGEYLYQQSRGILESRRAVVQGMSLFLDALQGEVCLGASTIPGEYLLPGLIGRFHTSYPEVRVGLKISDTQAVSKDVEEGRVELGFVGARVEGDHLDFQKLTSDRLICIVPPSDDWRNKERMSLEELQKLPLLIRESGSGTQMALERELGRLGNSMAAFHVVAELGSTTAIKEAVKAGVGWAIVSDLAVRDEVASGLLRTLQVDDMPTLERRFFVVSNRRRARSPICEAFLAMLSGD